MKYLERKSTKRSIDISDDLYAKFKEMAASKGITFSAFIKLAAMEYCEREEKKRNIE